MAKKRIADVLVDTLIAADVKRVYGLVGDSLNGVTDSLRPRKDLPWVPVRHEETAAFAAGPRYGRPVAWIAADIVRIEDGRLANAAHLNGADALNVNVVSCKLGEFFRM